MTRHQWNVRYSVVGALVSWIGIGLEFFITLGRILSQGRHFQDALILFFSFFTILTNILVACAFTAVALVHGKRTDGIKKSRVWNFLASPFILGGIAPSIALVGIVYNLVLRQLWHPTGWARVADELLHVVVPIGFVIYWCLYVAKTGLRWRDALTWAIYPILYLVYALVHGALSGVYAYPFIDVTTLGYGAVLINSLGILIGFLVMALIFIAFDRRKAATVSNSSA
ncbi:Pr6Pr family membrane protein [Glaciimonas sp. CA11.2]|uniref:Pr6Pr family membrane protein n=1 Tax=unclassified Glaciimonas TaxID=2644401 RepID=UPI002AB53EF2|nr:MULTISPECIES: Pr6Pr family membrane protein [unclassified Glaciimonas]MDY7547340.1 Pr6Pr family membrane protein [Glaciimonas sp. CA11.2]MEB0012627.1 Pr6Pr family membrane protein [Glaciimonas sp. Cout2]MEB0083032.1 Pr6Pr family membrane protein [Glaciimonas sp. Gout2]MEB0163226.1 Pr6Pr family membrane protein [Glaciimonas sp. CA11.2]